MDFSAPSSDLIALLVALCAAGIAVGFLAGLLGVGGGAILVPILYEAFRQAGVNQHLLMHITLGTSFAVIVPTALRSFHAHWKLGAVDKTALFRLAPFVFAGVFVGISLITSVSGTTLKAIWGICAVAIAVNMLVGRKNDGQTRGLPKTPTIELAAFLIGILSTLMSVGGGIFFVSMFVFLGWPMLRAVATSSGFGPIIAVPALVGYIYAGFGNQQLPPLSVGYVNLVAAIVIIPLSILAAPVGVRFAHRISRRRLEICFAAFLLASAANLCFASWRDTGAVERSDYSRRHNACGSGHGQWSTMRHPALV